MKKCQACAAENRDSSRFCDECGTMLTSPEKAENSPGAAVNKRPSEQADFRPQISEQPVFQSSSATSVGIPAVSAFDSPQKSESFERNGKESSVHAALMVERGDLTGTKFTLTADESNIGRWDADNGVFPDVDLDKHDPEAKISRRHARIRRRKTGDYTIEDLGSTNGTFVNRGRRLIPGNENALADGDEIIIGKTFLRFQVGDNERDI